MKNNKQKTYKAIAYITSTLFVVDVIHGIDDKIKVVETTTGKVTYHKLRYDWKSNEEFYLIRGCRYSPNEMYRIRETITIKKPTK